MSKFIIGFKNAFSAHGIASTALQVSVMCLFIVSFFFTYVRKLEVKILQKQVKYLVDSFIDPIKPFLTSKIKSSLGTQLEENTKNFPTADDLRKDQKTLDSNKDIRNMAIKYCIIGALSGLGICAVLWALTRNGMRGTWGAPFDLKELGKQMIVVLATTALAEWSFATFIAGNALSIDPNAVKKFVVEQFKTYAESP